MKTNEKPVIESFQLDHTKVIAPYIRFIGTQTGVKGEKIVNLDIRLTQPNVQFIDPSSIHSIEHSAAGLLREYLPKSIHLIDSSPFGCLTGFHNILLLKEDLREDEIVSIMIESWTRTLKAILEFKDGDVPAVSEIECGNAAMHSLQGAKMWAKRILEQGFSSDPFTRVVNFK